MKISKNDLLDYDVVVFSHLRWEFVLQRPQHIMNRLAKDKKVLFVEEPVGYDPKDEGTARIFNEGNVTVLQPRISWNKWTDNIELLVKEEMKKLGIENYIVWFYSAMFIDILPRMDASLVVYDCMDELSAFKGAPPELISKEKQLLTIADVTFTGGKSLYESKKKISENVYCFPSSVDQKHFEKSLKNSTIIPEDIKNLDKPVVGFYGVIDERIDLELLEKVAKALPDVSFVMIGPVVKISESDLPKQDNIHYLGGKKYQELPEYLKGIDIAMMPFALNESTKFISPTKTLEFMAAFKPIISTAITDVVRDYKKEVAIVSNAEEFVKAVQQFMIESSSQKKERIALQEAVLKKTSWDNTVTQMKTIINKAIEKSAVATKNATKKVSSELPVINQFTIKNLKVAYE